MTVQDKTVVMSQKENRRQAWSSKVEYILAAVGNAVGLGNIWRFSYLCQKHGGGAFLVPYFITLITVGYPLLFLEMAIGQKMQSGCIGVWSTVSPYLSGIGFASVFVCVILALYYNIILSWAMLYAANSFRFPLPWANCPEFRNETVIASHENISQLVPECKMSSPTVYFWYRETLEISDSIESGGQVNWKIAVALLVAWIFIFFGIMRGTKSVGKIMYFTVVLPYILLTIFLIRALLLEGAMDGIIYLIIPNVSKLGNYAAWKDAITQIFFSLGLGYGVYIAYASYIPRKNNCMFDTLFVATANSFTSIYAAVTVFAVLGFKATLNHKKCLVRNQKILNETLSYNETPVEMNYTIDTFGVLSEYSKNQSDLTAWKECSITKELDQAVGGTGLAFIAFAEAIVQLPASNFWSVIFFIMLVNIGVSSLLGSMSGILAGAKDIKIPLSKFKMAFILCCSMYLGGIMFALHSGSYLLDIIDSNVAAPVLLFIILSENLAVNLVYGLNRFMQTVKLMTGKLPALYWSVCLKWICPFVLTICLGATIVDYFLKEWLYSAWDERTAAIVKKVYPWWAIGLVVVLIVIALLCLPIAALLHKKGWVNMKRYAVSDDKMPEMVAMMN